MSFPDTKQNPGEPAASPASAGSPLSSDIRNISYEEQNLGVENRAPSYGLHVSSFKKYRMAFVHCASLRKQGFDTWINQVDLGDKGIWYRVLVGNFASVNEAQAGRPDVLAVLQMDRATVYERVLPKTDGSHLLRH